MNRMPPGTQNNCAVNPHAPPPADPPAMFASLWLNRQLILQMTKREVLSRYRGSVVGLAWSFFNPLLMLVIYTFVFSVVFKARWGVADGENKVDFAIVLFVGLIVHGFFAECLNRAPGLILHNVNYVKKVVFPLEIMTFVALLSALFHAAVSLSVLLTVKLIFGQGIEWTLFFLPAVLFPLAMATAGLTWFVAALGVYLRDVGQMMGVFTSALLFLSPVFYPLTAIRDELRPLLLLNPLTFPIEQARAVLIWGAVPNFFGLALYGVLGFVVAWLGFWWFQRTRQGFADVI